MASRANEGTENENGEEEACDLKIRMRIEIKMER
ncbi:uncharacterized protein G2W53_033055 [Senna tora]|uniref:Uncharacterized protein n=1 Tax=Senna tora TaxID=362788 RepID=A0A834SXR1_9FABA|nr:uncharacterized protein G2W53_033055 [Senna tora]